MFSSIFFNFLVAIQERELEKISLSGNGEAAYFYTIQRDDKIKKEVLNRLLNINFFAVLFGALLSYLLARKTLRPVFDSVHKQDLFISNASHELRTPLTAMKLENEMLLESKNISSKEYRELLKSNLEEIDKLKNLSDMLLTLSRNKNFEFTKIELLKVFNSVIEKLKISAKEKNIEIVLKCKNTEINSNEEVLKNLISIILENAIKYSPEKSKVEIGNIGKKVYIKDEGEGIKKEEEGFIFERFFKGGAGKKENGFGLGLALAKELATKLGAKISVKNNQKVGATFYLDL